jgi:alcohol dehydrogenase
MLSEDGCDIPAWIHGLTGGVHVAVDAVGTEQTCADAIRSLRRRGRHVQVGLLPPVAGHPRVPMDRVIAWELDLLGSHGMSAADYPDMLDLIASGALAPQDLIERVVGLGDAAQLLPAMERATPAGITIVDPAR